MANELKRGLGVAVGKTLKWIIVFSVLVMIFGFGVAYGQTTFKPQIVTKIEYVPEYIVKEVEVIREVEVAKNVYPTGFRQFQSQQELGRWQAKYYPELQELGKRTNWICVDYALEIQRRAWLDGYQMSIENLIDEGGKTGHAICSTWIGDNCIYLEPQSTTNWVGAVRGDVGFMYKPIQVYPETGEAVYREEQ